jgi:hypothetical protein
MNTRRLAALAAFLLAVVAGLRAQDGASVEPSPFDRPARPMSYEFTIGHLPWKTSGPFTGITKNFRPNPIPYRIELTELTFARPLVAAGSDSIWRNFDFLRSIVWSSITRGPEHHWGGATLGFRYNYALPARWHTSLFASYQGGVGLIDSSGLKYAQETDLTFTYVAALGFRTQVTDRWEIHWQVLGQHISNGWQTHPSEGIDCGGFSLAVSYRPKSRR